MKTIGIIPDSHARPGIGVRRWGWAARLFASCGVDTVVHLGDHWDMPSLCDHDKNAKDFKLRSYVADLQAGHRALDLFDEVLCAEGVSPKKVMLGGNHDEGRVKRYLHEDNRFPLKVSDFHRPDWKWIPFQKTHNIAGVHFCHYFTSGLMGRPIGGENPATSLLNKNHVSCVAGHNHLWDYSERTLPTGRKIQALTAGCFLEIGQKELYAGPSQKMWRNGLTILYGADEGQFDFEFWSIERLKRSFQ